MITSEIMDVLFWTERKVTSSVSMPNFIWWGQRNIWMAKMTHNIPGTFPTTSMSHKDTLWCQPSARTLHFPVNEQIPCFSQLSSNVITLVSWSSRFSDCRFVFRIYSQKPNLVSRLIRPISHSIKSPELKILKNQTGNTFCEKQNAPELHVKTNCSVK